MVQCAEINAMFHYIARAQFTAWETDQHCAYNVVIIIRCIAPYSATRETTTSVGLAHARPSQLKSGSSTSWVCKFGIFVARLEPANLHTTSHPCFQQADLNARQSS